MISQINILMLFLQNYVLTLTLSCDYIFEDYLINENTYHHRIIVELGETEYYYDPNKQLFEFDSYCRRKDGAYINLKIRTEKYPELTMVFKSNKVNVEGTLSFMTKFGLPVKETAILTTRSMH